MLARLFFSPLLACAACDGGATDLIVAPGTETPDENPGEASGDPEENRDAPTEVAEADTVREAGAGGSETGAEPDGTTDDPAGSGAGGAVSDTFEGTALGDDWTLLYDDTTTIEVRDGRLWMTPNEYTVWFHADHGPGVVQLVDGDFSITTTVRARSTRNPDRPVTSYFQFAGLIVRDPASDGADVPENYVFSVVGYRGDYLSAETKNTVNDLSMVDGPAWESGDAEIRICRVGASFRLFIRPVGGDTWQPAIAYDRPDLPDRLQAGAIAYTYTQDVDLEASFEEIVFAPVASAADCTAD